MLRSWLDKLLASARSEEQDKPGDREQALRTATALLLVDVARADQVFDELEMQRVIELMAKRFKLSDDDAARLVKSADSQADELVSLHETTQLLHRNLGEDEKADIVRLLWEVAYADGQLDKYEDSLILKISDLLYVSRGRVMGLKFEASRNA